MKKILLLVLSIAIVLSAVCIAVVADEQKEEQVLQGETITVVFTLPEEYTNITSGALSYEFDENAFELVEDSAKWMLSSLFIKDVNTETGEAIFAFSSAKKIKGNLFTMTLKVKEDTPYGDYKVSAKVWLNKDEYIIDLVNTVSVVEEQVEFDDPTTPADFAAAVGRVNGSDVTEETYANIAEALAKYDALTSLEKKEAEGDYQKLLDKIAAYNGVAEAVNEESQSTLEVALSAISRVFVYISKLFKAFVQMIF